MSYGKFLRGLEEPLLAESFRSSWIPATPEIPYDVLVVQVGDPESQAWQLELSFLPHLESALDGAAILQAFAALPEAPTLEAKPELLEFLSRLNAKMPLGGFGVHDELGASPLVFYRHTVLIPEFASEAGEATARRLVLQATWLISYLLDLFGERVMDVAAGRRSQETALEGHPQAGTI